MRLQYIYFGSVCTESKIHFGYHLNEALEQPASQQQTKPAMEAFPRAHSPELPNNESEGGCDSRVESAAQPRPGTPTPLDRPNDFGHRLS